MVGRQRFCCLGWTFGILLAVRSIAPAADLKAPADANLNAVQFIDEHQGWAVGDQGVIWSTIDGGQTWELQPTGWRETLTSVKMLDFRVGYVGGRRSLPFLPGSAGLLLWTRDMGRRWLVANQPGQTGIANLAFFTDLKTSTDHGYLLGMSSRAFPTGMFATADGARSFNAVRGPETPGWLTGYFFDENTAIVGGHHGAFALLNKGELTPIRCDWQPGAAVRCITGAEGRVFAVGDQAQLMTSSDRGKTWRPCRLPIPNEARSSIDFTSVSVAGDHVWVAGRPGSVVLHSWDAGLNWKLQKTGQPLPIHALSFPDARHGWAVGALGTILATEDGGETWTRQRTTTDQPTESPQAAILWLTATGQQWPLSTVARYGVETGAHVVACQLVGPDLDHEPIGSASRADRFADGFRAAGGSRAETCWLFPHDPHQSQQTVENVIRRWNRLHEGQTALEMERQLVLALRLWRPLVVVTDPMTAAPGASPLAALVAQGVQKACVAAADPLSFPEQITALGLAPTAPTRLFVQLPEGKGVVNHSSTDISQRCQCTYAELAETGLSIAVEQPQRVESSASFQLQAESPSVPKFTGQSLLAGLTVPASARRVLPQVTEPTVEQTKSMQARRNMSSLVQNQTLAEPNRIIGSLSGLVKDISPTEVPTAIHQLAREMVDAGRWEHAAVVFEFMVQKYPEHALALPAQRWLMSYYGSTETRMRAAKLAIVEEGRQAATPRADKTGADQTTQQNRQEIADPRDQKRRFGTTALVGNLLRKTTSVVWSDPQVQLLLSAAHRELGQMEPLNAGYDRIIAAGSESPWAEIARTEKWWFDRSTAPPRPVAACPLVGQRPTLDGMFDEEYWAAGPAIKLLTGDPTADEQFASKVQFRHDDGYLYIAAQMTYPSADFQRPTEKRHGHDADLNQHDRLEIVLDLDRDYNTYYRLRVDQRGQTSDDCWGDLSWNPRWYVATVSDERGWRAEIAIPFAELHDRGLLTSETWALGVARIIPNVAQAGWIQPARPVDQAESWSQLQFSRQPLKRSNAAQAN